jgi:hypothetical protein
MGTDRRVRRSRSASRRALTTSRSSILTLIAHRESERILDAAKEHTTVAERARDADVLNRCPRLPNSSRHTAHICVELSGIFDATSCAPGVR